jgi:DNA primase
MQRIPEDMIERIAASNDIVEVIGSHFPLKRAGATYKALCPFHQERSPSFTVNSHKQLFKCFGCGAGGSVYRFVMLYENLSFIEAVRKLAARAGIPLIEQELTAEDQARVDMRRRLLALHADAAGWFHLQLMRQKSAEPAREYLKKRGLTAEVAKSWKIGFAPEGWDFFGSFARHQGYSVRELLESGLVSRKDEDDGGAEQPVENARYYDRFRNRIMFPICEHKNGDVIAFSGRTLEANPRAAKYVNSPETMIFTKGEVLFGLHRTMRSIIDKKSAIVCEGQIDLITAYEAGVTNVIAPQGTAFTDKQARMLKRYAEEVILCFDSDAAGEKAAERSLEALLAEDLGVRVAAMPPGEDPDSLIRSQGGPAFAERMAAAQDFFTFQVDRLVRTPEFQTPKGRANIAHKMAGWISLIKDAAFREAVMGQVTTRLEISMKEFGNLVGTLARRARNSGKGKAGADPVPENVATPLTDPKFRLLALAALHDVEACEWLRAAPFRDLLARETDAGLVLQILESSFVPGDRGSQNAFLSSLSAADEATISELLSEPPPAEPVTQASDCWNALARRQIQRHIEAVQARLRTPEIGMEEKLKMIEELTVLTTSLREVPPPSRPLLD